jgi:hypothetical protein
MMQQLTLRPLNPADGRGPVLDQQSKIAHSRDFLSSMLMNGTWTSRRCRFFLYGLSPNFEIVVAGKTFFAGHDKLSRAMNCLPIHRRHFKIAVAILVEFTAACDDDRGLG